MRISSGKTPARVAAEAEERDMELENILGNLLIAEYQVDKLRHRLVEKISSSYSSAPATDRSAYSFKVGSKWYHVSLDIQEQRLAIEEDDEESR